MDCGKSTLALQVDHNQSRQGRHGLRLTQGDRSRGPADQQPGGAVPGGRRARRRHRRAAAGPRPVGRRAPGGLRDRRRGAVPHRPAGRAAGRAGRRVARRRLRLRADHRLPRRAVPGHPAAVRAGRRRPADPGRGAVLVRRCRGCSTPGWSTARWSRAGRDRRRRRHRAGPRPGRAADSPPSATRCCAGGTTSAVSSVPPRPGRVSSPFAGQRAGRRAEVSVR